MIPPVRAILTITNDGDGRIHTLIRQNSRRSKSSAEIDAQVQEIEPRLLFYTPMNRPIMETATVELLPALTGGHVEPLPRGFSLALIYSGRFNWFPPGLCFNCPIDRHLLQVAFSRNPISATSWQSQAVFKNNDGDKIIVGTERVVLIGGKAVGVVGKPFHLVAHTFDKPFLVACQSPVGARKTESFMIENVPFEHAVPVLSGFDLHFNCGDQHVKEVGARIVDFRYDRPPGATSGTLHYRLESVLRDDGGQPNHEIRHNVRVLGFNNTGSVP